MRLFKQVTGQSFVDYIRHFRISKAQEFLVTTEKSMSDVSQQTGLCEPSRGCWLPRAIMRPPLSWGQITLQEWHARCLHLFLQFRGDLCELI